MVVAECNEGAEGRSDCGVVRRDSVERERAGDWMEEEDRKRHVVVAVVDHADSAASVGDVAVDSLY